MSDALAKIWARRIYAGTRTLEEVYERYGDEGAEKVQNASDHTQSTLKGLLQKKIDGRRAMRHEGTLFWRYRYHPRYGEARNILKY